MNCTLCGKQTTKFLSLGHHAPSDAFLKEEELNKEENTFPLDVFFCEHCYLVQLGYAVDPEILFRDYVYTTSSNNSLIKNFKELVETALQRFSPEKEELAVDIGSNDGTLLKGYEGRMKILGVDPSSVAEIAIKNGVDTVHDFFSHELAKKIVKERGKARIITATNVFAHVKDVSSLMKGIKELLSEKGIFIQESHYLLNLLTKMQWDSIYHEHLRYYSLLSLQGLFDQFDLELFDAEPVPTHGGSIRTYVSMKGSYEKTERLQKLLDEERKKGLDKKATYLAFGDKVREHKFKIQNMLRRIKAEGKKIVGIGAPAKGNTLLNYCAIDTDVLDYLVEKSTLKIGLFTPGRHIPVRDEKLLFDEQPDYALLLSWNIAEELIPKLKKFGYKGTFIVPLPSPHEV
ncbi:class I SAM-dependent methyltransferase [Candidatus Woesearchaeota archaeon]|nr:class I SAM-dependent methyltransferase [Candidatus Woesearchaeota archaeon]